MVIKSRVVIPIIAVIVIAAALSLYLFTTKKKIEEKPEITIVEPVEEKPEVTVTPPAEEKPLEMAIKEEPILAPPAEKEEIPPSSLYPWVVQVSACQSYTQAKNFQERLKNRGLRAYITEVTLKGEKWYRVRIGFYSTRKESVKIGEKIVSEFKMKDYWPIQPSKEEIEKHFQERT